MNNTSIQPPHSDTPERVPLTRLAARQDGRRSRILSRVVPQSGEGGPGRVAVAAFQSSV